MNIVISSVVVTNIESFYQNVARKYRNTYDYGDMHRDIDNAIDATLRIENGLLRRKPTISRWSGYFRRIAQLQDGFLTFIFVSTHKSLYLCIRSLKYSGALLGSNSMRNRIA